jgi:hypothetical protein
MLGTWLRGGAVVILGLAMSGSLLAAEDAFGPIDGNREKPAKTERAARGKAEHNGKAAASKRSPADAAFNLPKGIVLRPDQQEAIDKLRQQYTTQIQEAFDAVTKASDAKEKAKAAKEAKTLKEQVHQEIMTILNTPSPDAENKGVQQGNRGNMNAGHRGGNRGGVRGMQGGMKAGMRR